MRGVLRWTGGAALVAAGYIWCYLGMTAGVPPFPQLSAIKQQLIGEPPAPPIPAYYVRRSLFEHHARPADVVMVGDSILADVEWSDLFPEHRVSNRAIHGERLGGLLDRLPGIFAPRPSKVVILIGINDAVGGRSAEAIEGDYRRLIKALNGHGARLVVISTLPCSARAAHCDRANATVALLNRRLSALGNGVIYIDAARTMVTDGRLADRFSDDGVHLSRAGVEHLADLLRPYL